MERILGIAEVPVIFLSAYGRDETIARAFEAGAADYVVKPFSPTELVARVRAAMRRRMAPGQVEPSRPFALGDLTINYAERGVSVAGRPVRLTANEYGLLFELSVNAGRVLTHDDLLQRVWGLDHSGGRGTVRSCVKRLRRKQALPGTSRGPTSPRTEPRLALALSWRGPAAPRPSLRPGPTCAVGADHSNSLAGAPLATDASYLSPDSIHAPNSPGTATTPSSCLLASWRGRRASAWLLWQIQFCARLCSIRLTLPVPRSRRYGPRNQGRSASRPGTHLC